MRTVLWRRRLQRELPNLPTVKFALSVGASIVSVAIVGSGMGFAMARMRAVPDAAARIELGPVPAGALRRFQFEVANPTPRDANVHVVAGCGVELPHNDIVVPARNRISVVGWVQAPEAPGTASYSVDYTFGRKASSVSLSVEVQPGSTWMSEVDLADVQTGEDVSALLGFTPPPSWRGARLEMTANKHRLSTKVDSLGTLVAHDRWTTPVAPGAQERVYEIHPKADESIIYRRSVKYRVMSRYPVSPAVANLGLLPNPDAQVTVRIGGSSARLRVERLPAGISAVLRDRHLVVEPDGRIPSAKLISGHITLSTGDPREPRIQVPTFAFWKS